METGIPSNNVEHTAPAAPRGGIAGLFAVAEAWVCAHVEWFVWLIVLAGLYLRVDRATQDFFNGDEVQILLPPLQRGLRNVYNAGLVFPYGPFMNFVLHFMTFFGNSELYFRVPSILAGSLIPYAAFRWAAVAFGKGAGLAAAAILAFSPNLVNLSAEVRHYTIHTFWIVCACYFLERALQDRSSAQMRLFGASLLLALLTMYMSIWFTAAAGLYALVRIAMREMPRRLALEWVLIQAAAVGVCVAAYVTHLYKLRGIPSERLARETWLRPSYYHADSQSLVDYLTSATSALFDYVFANSTLGSWALFAFAAGVVLIVSRKAGTPRNRRVTVLALLLPLMVTFGAGVAAFYPYGGTRHDAFLSVFLAAGAGVTVSYLARGKLLVVLLAVAVLGPQWSSIAEHHYLEDQPQFRKIEQMKNAIEYFGTRQPRPRVLLVDGQAASLVAYYICGGQTAGWRSLAPNLNTFSCRDYQVLGVDDWAATEATLKGALSRARAIEPRLFPDPAWIFQLSLEFTSLNYVSNEDTGLFGRIFIRRIP